MNRCAQANEVQYHDAIKCRGHSCKFYLVIILSDEAFNYSDVKFELRPT
jgi:hypothetical protein